MFDSLRFKLANRLRINACLSRYKFVHLPGGREVCINYKLMEDYVKVTYLGFDGKYSDTVTLSGKKEGV